MNGEGFNKAGEAKKQYAKLMDLVLQKYIAIVLQC